MTTSVLRILRMVPMIIIMGTIFLLSHTPGDDLNFISFPGLDKVAHVVVYAVLAATVIFAFAEKLQRYRPFTAAAVPIIFCILYGVSDEWHQSFIPGRYVSIYDIAADGIGATVVSISWIWLNNREK